MNQRFSIFAIILMLCIFSCSKERVINNTTNIYTTFTPVSVPRSEAGIIVVSQNNITINKGATFTVSAKLYNSSGSLLSGSPSFLWSVDNSPIISFNSSNSGSVSNLTATANDTGFATLTVTDGSHGYAYIYVNIVSASTSIPSGANSISFVSPVVLLKTGESKKFDYSITNASGSAVAGTPYFVYPLSSGISIAGNTITAGNTPGVYSINAVIGTDTLNGKLNVVVYNNNSQNNDSTVIDTTWAITDVIRYPLCFPNPKMSAAPVIIQVTGFVKSKLDTISVITFQTSPDKIQVELTDIISVNNGLMESINPGITNTIIIYKNIEYKLFSSVVFSPNGNWGDGSICFGFWGYMKNIKYTNSGGSGLSFTGGNYDFGCDASGLQTGYSYIGGINFTFPIWSYMSIDGPGYGLFSPYKLAQAVSRSCGYRYDLFYSDLNHIKAIKYTNPGGQFIDSVKLTRGGSGNCGGGTTPLTLDATLSGRTWNGNACFADVSYVNSLTFNSDHTIIVHNTSSGNYSATWSATNNNIHIYAPTATPSDQDLPVISYTNNLIKVNIGTSCSAELTSP